MPLTSVITTRIIPVLGAVLCAGAILSLSGCSGGGGSGGATNPGGGLNSSTLVFVSTRDGNQEIYSLRSDGTGATRLTNNAAADSTPCRSRDGLHIVFSSVRDGNPEIYIMGPGGETDNLRRLTSDSGASTPSDTSPVISPDGTKILWTSTRGGGTSFWTMNIDGSNQVQVSGTSAAGVQLMSWHPNNVRFLGRKVITGASESLGNFTSGGAYTPLLTMDTPRHARYSPDGSRITASEGATGTKGLIAYLQADGTRLGQLPATSNSDATEPTWSPNGQQIVWTSGDSALKRQLFIVRPGDLSVTKLTSEGENFSPSWGD